MKKKLILSHPIFSKKVFDKLNSAINNNAFDLDTEIEDDDEVIPTIDCQYYNVDDFSSAKFNPTKTFSILHYNIHSIERHIEEFRVILKMIDFNFDIICISESKVIKDCDPKVDISIDGYQTPISTPTESTKGDVLIYVKSGINFKPRNDLNLYKSKELVSLFIEVINKKESNDIIGVIYRHPCMNGTDFIDEYLKGIVDKLSNESFEFFDTMMSNFLLPVITLPTKVNRGKNTLIDNIFTNHLHPDNKSGNLEIDLSDGHLPSFMIMPQQNQNHLPKKHNLYTHNSTNFSRENFILDYLNIDWDEVIDINRNDINFFMDNFLSKFNALLDGHMPLRKLTQKEFKQKFKPWISENIIGKITKQNKIFRKYINCKNDVRKAELFEQFKILKNETTHLTRSGKKAYYQKYFAENKNNLQKIWKGIKEIINIKSKNFDYPTCLLVGDINITDPTAITNSFNDYFTSIADDILKKRKYNGTNSHRNFLANRLVENFVFEECNENEVKSIISTINVSKSSGPNSIPTHILHLLKEEICKPLNKIFNLSFSTGQYPNILKISKTIPIFKKGSRLLVSNYRPISLLSNLNKILEKIVHERIYKFLEDYQCIYSLQFGFRKKHSTNHALIDITETIRQALDNKKFACGIFVDLQKAFDTVNHDILIDKLEHYGIRGTANNWFASYLKNRSQFVSTLGFDSSIKPVAHGVPQGSVLGPLLFLIYINDLHMAIKSSKVYHFADDTNLLNIGNSPKIMQKLVNADLKILYKWLLANKISLNCDKTEIIFFHKPGEIVPEMKIKMNGHRIYLSNNIKYLGIYLDETLNGGFHCETLMKKLKRANGMLCKARHYITNDDLKTLYYAIFSSHLIYGCQIWGQTTNVFNQKIFKLQNRALRIISFSDFSADCNPLYASLNIIKLEDQIILQNCLFVHDALSNVSPICFQEYFKHTREIHSANTKSARLGCLFVTHSGTVRYGLNSITNKCISNWNDITKKFNIDLFTLKRYRLKYNLKLYFGQSYL